MSFTVIRQEGLGIPDGGDEVASQADQGRQHSIANE
jgi:hypothetical protein